MHLHQHTAHHSGALALRIDEPEQALGIDALYQRHASYYLPHLVSLQMAYEMPAHIAGHLRNLGKQLLNAALTKHSLPRIVSLAQSLYGVKLRHSIKLHALGQSGTDSLNPVGNTVHSPASLASLAL